MMQQLDWQQRTLDTSGLGLIPMVIETSGRGSARMTFIPVC